MFCGALLLTTRSRCAPPYCTVTQASKQVYHLGRRVNIVTKPPQLFTVALHTTQQNTMTQQHFKTTTAKQTVSHNQITILEKQDNFVTFNLEGE